MKLQRVLLLLLGFCLCALVGLGVSVQAANADVDIWVPGNTDCTGQGYAHAGANPTSPDNTNVPVAYSTCDGSFAPFMGSTTPPDAIAQGVAATRAKWDQYCASGAEHCVLHGFSLGAPIVTIVGNDVGADKIGSNTHIITEGNAWGTPGVFGGKPGLLGVGINIGAQAVGLPLEIPQLAGSENRFTPNDAFAANSGQTPAGEITQLSCINGCGDVPPQHFIQQGDPTAEFHTADDVRQEVYGDPLPGVIAPQDNPLVNPELVPQVPLAPVAPVLADPFEAMTQQFAGVPPCFAPDGAQYRTPAGVGC